MKDASMGRQVIPIVTAIAMWVQTVAGMTAPEPVMSEAHRSKGVKAVEQALAWFTHEQNPDGSFGVISQKMAMPAFSGMALLGFLYHGYTEKDPVVKKGVEYLLTCVKPDGGIHGGMVPTQNTGICLMVLHATHNPKYAAIIKKAREFLIGSQVDEGEKKNPADAWYGGIGYDSKGKPDLQNLRWAVEALRATTTSADRPTGDPTAMNEWDRALLFIQRCQHLKGSNDRSWAENDGGFIYAPDPESKAGGTKSYGTMTYAGLLSLLYCEVDRDDKRVQAAYNWIRTHYTLDENPGMGPEGLFYGYQTFAKALDVYGMDVLKDEKGVAHRWREELIDKLVSLQQKDGTWVNTDKRWFEDKPLLVTGYTVLALQRALGEAK